VKATRQASSRVFPPQSDKSTIISRIVETWEELPVNIRVEERKSVVIRKIKAWTSKRKE
jgi:hypothetical protein